MDIYNNDNCNIMMQQDAALAMTNMYINLHPDLSYSEDRIYGIYKDFKNKLTADGLDKNTFMGSI